MHFIVKDLQVSCDGYEVQEFICGTDGHYRASFDFDDSWIGLSKRACFTCDGVDYHSLIEPDSTCLIPIEIIDKQCVIYVNVKAEQDGVERETTVPACMRFIHSILTDCRRGVPGEQNPNIYSEVLNAAKDALVIAQSVEDRANDGEFNGAKGDTGNSGVYIGSGEMPDDCNVQIDPDGDVLTIDQTFNPESSNPQSGKAVAEAVANVSGGSENWVQIVNEKLTENIATEFRVVFDKPYKKLRFKIVFKGSSSTSLSSVRFKKTKTDGGVTATAKNYLKFSCGSLGTPRFLWGTLSFDVDGQIVINDGGISTGYAVLSGYCTTLGNGYFYTPEEQNFPEFYFYLGGSIAEDGTLSGNVIGENTSIQVWGCE